MSNKSSSINRRRFLGMAGALATTGFAPGPLLSGEIDKPVFSGENSAESQNLIKKATTSQAENAIAKVVETKVICKEPGQFLGHGTEYQMNINGHVVIKNRIIEGDRYLGWPTVAKTNEGELIVAFSGDRDAHVCPWGKTQIIRSKDQGKTWSEPETITSTPLDDRDAGLIQTKKGTLLVSWFTSMAFARPNYEAAYHRYARHSEKIMAGTRKNWLSNWVRRSEDGGKSWQEPIKTVASAPHVQFSYGMADCCMLVLVNGRGNQLLLLSNLKMMVVLGI
jgi:hypothetical protein